MTAETRQLVIERAGGFCEYCLWPTTYAPGTFSVEHIFPRAKGGTDDEGNLALSCPGCNGTKYTATEAIDPATGQVVPLFHPRQHQRELHFAWDTDEITLIGLTPTGRATIERLHLNREEVLNIRRVLRQNQEALPL
jgi:HNH endonuclease